MLFSVEQAFVGRSAWEATVIAACEQALGGGIITLPFSQSKTFSSLPPCFIITNTDLYLIENFS